MILKPNFKYPDIKPEHGNYRFGATNAGEVIRPDGDWRDYLPPVEEQNINGIESSACYVEGSQHAIATIQEEEFGVKDSNYSSRFNALLSDGTEYGGDPLVGADSIRNDGLIPDSMMPFENITSWDEFHSWKGVKESVCRAVGRLFKTRWKLNNYIVFERDNPVEYKYKMLREALKRSPVPMSVYGWVQDGSVYTKPKGVYDNHLVTCVYLDEQNRPVVRDTYKPFEKTLEPYYNSDFAMRWTVKQIDKRTVDISVLQRVLELLRKLNIIK